MEFRILGPLEAWDGGSPVALGGAKQRALLAVLLLHANEVVSTERLIDLLWDEPPAKATKAVQVYASRLRKALGGQMPASRPRGYVLELSPEQLDLGRFRRLRDQARLDPSGAAETLTEALALWRGQALAEFPAEPFAQVERGRLEEERIETLEERIEAELAVGGHPAVVGELEALVAAHPLRERLRGQLMIALYRCGRQADALAAYRQVRSLLVGELGIEPGRSLQQLEQAILRQDPALELARDPERASVRPPVRSAAPREERKVVSVLFVELIRDRTETDPEDLRPVLHSFTDAARRQIERFGGTVETFIGDELMAVFGAPAAHEDDAERAVRSALTILRSVGETHGELRVRLAVDTGNALVLLNPGLVGVPATAGDVVTRARRLLVAAPPGGILVGEQTYAATRETIDYRETPPGAAEGTSQTISSWQVVRARARRGFDPLRVPVTPLVGRERELDLLVSALARVVEERSPQLVTLVGVPGIGKSRLVFELERRLERERAPSTWLQGRCLSYGDGVSFWALGEIIKTQAGILESDDREQAEEKLCAAVSEVITATDEVAWVERELRPLVGASRDPGRIDEFGEAFLAWRRFLERLAESTPLVLVLEDMQWADDGLLAFVDELAVRVRDASLLVLCTARPELLDRRPGWGGGKPNALTVSLSPLADDETATLVRGVLGRPALEEVALRTLLTRVGGNPLFAEQFVRILTEVGWSEELPDTVHGLIAARLDGLLPEEKAVLQDAAVVGQVFWVGALASLGEVGRREVEERLAALERKEFVRQARDSSVAGDSEYDFRHILLRDVAYGQMPRAARAEKHRRAARWIESLGRSDDHSEMLAHHYWNALEYARAAGRVDQALVERTRLNLRAAGDRAFSVASYMSAARYYSRALAIWPEDDSDRARLLVRAGHAQHAADGTGIDLLEQGFEELMSSGTREDAAEVAVEVARRFWLVGERDAAHTYIERALRLVEHGANSPARAYALVERAAYHMNATEHAEAISLVREALPLTRTLGLDHLHVRALDVLGSSRVSLGDLGGLEDTRRAVALARELGAFYRLVVAELNFQGLLVFVGQLSAASDALRALRQDVERHGTADQKNWLRVVDAHEAVLHGRWEEGVRILDERLAEAGSGNTHYSDPACLALRASIAVARGDLAAATIDAERALDGARRIRDPQLLAPALAMRAIVQLARGEPNAAARDAHDFLAQGSVLIPALLELHPTVTPVELAWLARDLEVEAELLASLESAPSTPWYDAAGAIATGNFERSIEIVVRIGAPCVEAYARLRAAESVTTLQRIATMQGQIEQARDFFRKVRAWRYLARAEQLLADLASA